MKIICHILYVQIECQLGYLMMLIFNGICQYSRKYAVLSKKYAIFRTVTERVFRVCDATLRPGFLPENTLGDGPAFWIFPGFTDKGYDISFFYQFTSGYFKVSSELNISFLILANTADIL